MLQQVDQAQVAEQRVEQPVHVLPALGERVDPAQELARLALRDEVDEVDEGLLGHEAEQAHGILDGDRAVARRRELVEDRERVAVGAGAGAGDEMQDGVGRLDALRLAHAREHLHELARPGPPEREALAARADRVGSLRGSVVQSTNTTCGGGSSSVFRRAFEASGVSECASSRM